MTDTTEQQAVTVAQIDWRDPIDILPLGGGPLVPAIVVAGPDKDGDYRVSFRDRSPNSWVSGLQWFHADGTPCGATGHRVLQARHSLASVSSASEDAFLGEIHKRTPTGAWIAVQHHPDGDWSVAEHPLPWLPGQSPEPVPATNQAGEAWPGRNLDLAKARVTVLGKLGLMLSVMAGGEAAEVIGYDAADLYSEVLMALAIEDAEDTDIALEVARDYPDGDMLVDALATQPATSQEGEA